MSMCFDSHSPHLKGAIQGWRLLFVCVVHTLLVRVLTPSDSRGRFGSRLYI